MHKRQTESRDPADLGLHPVLKQIPDTWGKEDPCYIALVEDVRERGIDQPFIIDSENRIMDGRRRHRAARQLQLAAVPCIVRPESEVFGIVLNSFLQRAHYNLGGRAYLTFPLMEPYFAEFRSRRLKNLHQHTLQKAQNHQKPQQTPESALSALSASSVEELADQIGIGRRLYFQAQEVHKLFHKHTDKRDLIDTQGKLHRQLTFREFYEPRILRADDPYGLGAVIAGIKSSLINNGRDKAKVAPALTLFGKGWHAVGNRMRYWTHFDREQRAFELFVRMRLGISSHRHLSHARR